MKKVLHVISDSNIGGAGILVLSLLRHIDRTKFEPILCLPRNSLLAPRAEALGVRLIPLDGEGDKTLSLPALLQLFQILREERPHILHTHASLSARLAALTRRDICCVDTKHCCFPLSPRQTSPLARLLFRAFERLCRVSYIATAEAAKAQLCQRGAKASRITVIHGGGERIPRLSPTEKTALRASLGIPKDAFVVGYAARAVEGKGHHTLLKAARLLAKHRDILWLVVGSGPQLESLRASAVGLDNVIFTGFREDIGRVMNLFDISLNCSYLSETSPLSLSESMSLGIPLVVTDVGGNAPMAKDCGLVLPPRDPEALAEAVLELRNHTALYQTLSDGAARRFSLYAAERMTRKTEALYLSLLAHR